MIDGNRVLGVIPARGGSKGVPRKNIRDLAGKPLIAWSIEAAQQSRYLDRVVLSSEDAEIIRVAQACGCDVPFVRPQELAEDDVSGAVPPLHALGMLPGYDMVVVLQPTSPLRSVADIDGCLERCISTKANACVSVVQADKTPHWMMTLDADHRMTPFVSWDAKFNLRQDLPPTFVLNGAVYVAYSDWLHATNTFLTEETVAFEMPKERSVDIDTELDFLVAEALIGRLKGASFAL